MRRLAPLTGADVHALPGPCSSCLFWELAGPSPEPSTTPAVLRSNGRDAPTSDVAIRKQAWVSTQVQEGHPPGRLVQVDDEVAGYALFGRARSFAPHGPLVPPVSDDALLLATLWVAPHWRRRGLGRLLVQAAVKDAIRVDAQGVEVYGDRRWRERSCVLPVTWLLHEGFEVHREHVRVPLLRLDVRRTARWAESLEHALEEVMGALPRRVPVPAPDRAVVVPERGRGHAG